MTQCLRKILSSLKRKKFILGALGPGLIDKPEGTVSGKGKKGKDPGWGMYRGHQKTVAFHQDHTQCTFFVYHCLCCTYSILCVFRTEFSFSCIVMF